MLQTAVRAQRLRLVAFQPAHRQCCSARARSRRGGRLAAASEPPPPPNEPERDEPTPTGGGTQDSAPQQDLQLSRELISRIRTSVFGLGGDTFFATSVENYEQSGVLFKGNLRGDASKAYARMSAKLREELGDEYTLFLLEDQQSAPVAVVLPTAAVKIEVPALAEAALALLFAGTTVLTTMNVNAAGDLFNLAFLAFNPDPQVAASTLPGTAALLGVLGAHELGHLWAAQRRGLDLAPPLLLPAGLGLLGSLGAITRVKSQVPDREALAEVAAAGPWAGTAVSLVLLFAGLALTLGGQGGIELEASSFRDSLLVGSLGQAFLGDRIFTAESVSMSPLFVAGWAGLIIQALNCLPAGELDGGRLALGLWGRRAATRWSALTLLLLGVAGIFSTLPLFWLLVVLFLQRGPIIPCDNELSGLSGATRTAALAALFLPLIVLLPYPFVPTPDVLPDLPPLSL